MFAAQSKMTEKYKKFPFDRTDFAETESQYKLRRAGEREGVAITYIKILAPKPASKPRAYVKRRPRIGDAPRRKRAIREKPLQTALEQRGNALGSLQELVHEITGNVILPVRADGRTIRDIGDLTVDELFCGI